MAGGQSVDWQEAVWREPQVRYLLADMILGEQQFKSPIPASQVPAYLQAVQLRGGAWAGRVD